jgi:hypothetical protein
MFEVCHGVLNGREIWRASHAPILSVAEMPNVQMPKRRHALCVAKLVSAPEIRDFRAALEFIRETLYSVRPELTSR